MASVRPPLVPCLDQRQLDLVDMERSPPPCELGALAPPAPAAPASHGLGPGHPGGQAPAEQAARAAPAARPVGPEVQERGPPGDDHQDDGGHLDDVLDLVHVSYLPRRAGPGSPPCPASTPCSRTWDSRDCRTCQV